MSPTEAELRAALREGAGDRLDPDAVITRARAARRRRLGRVAAITASVAVVAAIGITAGLALRPKHYSHPAAAPPPPVATCAPSITAPHPPLGTTARGTIFTAPPTTITVCLYREPGLRLAPGHSTILFTGSAAAAVAASFGRIGATPQVWSCPPTTGPVATLTVVLHPITRTGPLPDVTITGFQLCGGGTVVSGSTVRGYGWTPPAALAGALDRAAGGAATASPKPTGAASGSPTGSPPTSIHVITSAPRKNGTPAAR